MRKKNPHISWVNLKYLPFQILCLASVVARLFWKALSPLPHLVGSRCPLPSMLWPHHYESRLSSLLPSYPGESSAKQRLHTPFTAQYLTPPSLWNYSLEWSFSRQKVIPFPSLWSQCASTSSPLPWRDKAVWAAIPSLHVVHILYLVWQSNLGRQFLLEAGVPIIYYLLLACVGEWAVMGLWEVPAGLSVPRRGLFLSIYMF